MEALKKGVISRKRISRSQLYLYRRIKEKLGRSASVLLETFRAPEHKWVRKREISERKSASADEWLPRLLALPLCLQRHLQLLNRFRHQWQLNYRVNKRDRPGRADLRAGPRADGENFTVLHGEEGRDVRPSTDAKFCIVDSNSFLRENLSVQRAWL